MKQTADPRHHARGRRPLGAAGLVYLTATALLLATPARAQEEPQPDPAQLALGRRLAEAGDFNAVIGAMGAAEIERVAAEADLDDAGKARLRETGARVLATARAALIERVAPIYAAAYPPDQLAAIVAFLESPAGRAYAVGTGARPGAAGLRLRGRGARRLLPGDGPAVRRAAVDRQPIAAATAG